MKKQNSDAGYIAPAPLPGGLNFGQALEEVKRGKKIAREGWAGWGGEGQYVFLAHAVDFDTDAEIPEMYDDDSLIISDFLVIRTAGNVLQAGWTPSQADMLAEDWHVAC